MMRYIETLSDSELTQCYYLVLKLWFRHPEYKLLRPIIMAYQDELENRDIKF